MGQRLNFPATWRLEAGCTSMEPASSGFCSFGLNSAQISPAAPGAKKRRARCATRLRLSRCRSLTVGPAKAPGVFKSIWKMGRGLSVPCKAQSCLHAAAGMRMLSRQLDACCWKRMRGDPDNSRVPFRSHASQPRMRVSLQCQARSDTATVITCVHPWPHAPL